MLLVFDVASGVVGCILRCLGLLHHLDLLIDKMNQKSSVIQILKSVQRVLTSDTTPKKCTLSDNNC